MRVSCAKSRQCRLRQLGAPWANVQGQSRQQSGGAFLLSPDAPPRCPQISDTSMYSLIGAARHLKILQLTGFDFPLAANGHCHLAALGGMRLRHLVLVATRFQDDARRSLADALMTMLADLPQLVSLEMSFPRCAARQALQSVKLTAAQGCSALRSAARLRSSCFLQCRTSQQCALCVGR